MLTGQNLIDRIYTALSGSMHTKFGGDLFVANLAGRWIMAAREWRWATRQAVLYAVPGDTVIYLPGDFRGELDLKGRLLGLLTEVTPGLLADMREQVIPPPNSGSYYGYMTYAETGDGTLVPAIEIHPPVPASGEDSVGRVVYSGAWRDVASETDPVKVPWFMDGVVLSTVAAYALGNERPKVATLAQRLMDVQASPEWHAACTADDAMQSGYGSLLDGEPGRTWQFPANDPVQA